MALLNLEQVSLVYPGQPNSRPSLSNISLAIHEGEFISLVGPSGGGKSSTISLLAGLITPTGGRITLNGKDIHGPGPDRAVVFQDYSLFPWMTALENINFALKQIGAGSKSRALELLAMVGLEQAAGKYPSALSGGMRQRVAIARAFALEAPVYLMDEPFGAVDAKSRADLQDLLLKLWTQDKKKKTIIFVTHDIDEALYLSDRVIVFSMGRLRQILPVQLVRPRYRMQLINNLEYLRLRSDILALLQTEVVDGLDLVEGGTGI